MIVKFVNVIFYSETGIPPPQFLQESLFEWHDSSQLQTRCGRAMLAVPAGSDHFLSSYYVQDPVTGQLL